MHFCISRVKLRVIHHKPSYRSHTAHFSMTTTKCVIRIGVHIVTLVNKTHNKKFKTGIEGLPLITHKMKQKKLHDEIDNLHRIVGGMTVPLWQFEEKSIGNKPLASRTVVTSVGGDHVQHKFDTPWQRHSINDLTGTRKCTKNHHYISKIGR